MKIHEPTPTRETHKEQFTIIAKFLGVKPCTRCEDPYCVDNLPHYERWDNLKPALERINDFANKTYPFSVFSLSAFGASTSIGESISMAVSFINYHNSKQA